MSSRLEPWAARSLLGRGPRWSAGRGRRRQGGNPQPTSEYLKAAIRKTPEEQFKQIGDHEVCSKVINGRRLHDQLKHDSEQWMLKAEYGNTLELAPCYYRALHASYADEEPTSEELAWDRSLEENLAEPCKTLEHTCELFYRNRPLRGCCISGSQPRRGGHTQQ